MTDPSEHISPEKLQDYARGRLSTVASRIVEEHIAVCADCRAALTRGLPAQGTADEADEHTAPPSAEIPETAELREIPSEVSVMSVPHTVEGMDRPSQVSVTTGIGPLNKPRRKPSRRSSKAGKIVLAVLLLSVMAGLGYWFGVRPHARSQTLARQAGDALQPVVASIRLADLQHPTLTGTEPYLPGKDQQLTETLARTEGMLARAVEADNGNLEARLMLALNHLVQGDPRVSRAQYNEVMALGGPSARIHMGLGILDYMASHVANNPTDKAYALKQADEHFAAIQLGDIGYSEAIYNRAVVALARDDAKEARRLLQVYTEIKPKSPWTDELAAKLEAS